MFLHSSNFGLGRNMSSAADFLNTESRAPALAEHAPCLPTWRVMQFELVMVIFHWLFFLINRQVAVVS